MAKSKVAPRRPATQAIRPEQPTWSDTDVMKVIMTAFMWPAGHTNPQFPGFTPWYRALVAFMRASGSATARARLKRATDALDFIPVA